MAAEKKKKIIKTIRIDVDKCHGCRACEELLERGILTDGEEDAPAEEKTAEKE